MLVVQYAGDYRDTWRRLSQGGSDNYFAQGYSDRAIAELAQDGNSVAILAGFTDEPYEEVLAKGITAIGLGAKGGVDEGSIVAYAERFDPTHVLLRAPFHAVLEWALARDTRIALTLADSFGTGLKAWLRSRKLVRLLNNPRVEWVANHGVAASGALVRIGVKPDKVVPWDWPHGNSPEQWASKSLPSGKVPWKALYVGAVAELKGVGDAIEAIATLARNGMQVHLDVIGSGEDFSPLVARLGLGESVTFRGRVPNAEIIDAMREADVVLVPSRKEYPEGFPLTVYEALCSRTPIVASDHPMLAKKLFADRSAVVFSAGDPAELAKALQRLLSSPDLYAALSAEASTTWQSLQVPVKWADFVRAWADGTPAGREWIGQHSWQRRHYE
ncbi:MAG: glycosyltransferase [Caldimonas sp.]